MADDLTRQTYDPKDVEELIAKVPDPSDAILVGGQAINFWATRYLREYPEIKEYEPFTSSDIDFVGDRRLAEKWAEAIDAELYLPDSQDFVAINTAKLVLPSKSAQTLELDILATIDGLETRKIRDSALLVESEDGTLEFCVLHPMHCLASVLANTYDKQRRRDYGNGLGERARDRCKLAVLLARAYLSETIELFREDEDAERPYDLIEFIARLASESYGLAAYSEDRIDVLEVIDETHPVLSDDFKTQRWPNIQEHTANARQKYKPGQVKTTKRTKL